ncbi:MAG TPA: hypothetical protein VKV04_25195 [Verrucomicrobiae bacterium]|nr:hypothetical protein [Verrucomicrobiae bacterium]
MRINKPPAQEHFSTDASGVIDALPSSQSTNPSIPSTAKDTGIVPQPTWRLMRWLSFLPPIALVALLFRNAVNIPYWDEWDDDLAGLFIKLKTGHLTLGDLWAPHNEGRLVLPKIFFLILGTSTHWNLIYEVAATFLMVCLITYAIYRLERPAFSERPGAGSIIFFISSLLLFSPAQSGAWLWGMEIILYVPLLCIVAALLILRSNLGETAKLVYCMVLATIATYSFSNGFLLWLVLFPAVFPVEDWHGLKEKPRNALCWLLASFGNVAAYFHNLGLSQSNELPWRNPWPALNYFFVFLGAPLVDRQSSHHLQSAAAIGLVITILFLGICFWIFRQRKNQSLIRLSLPWLTIGVYGVLSAVLAAAGRSALGTEQALSSRYGIFGISLIIALVHLIPILVFSDSAENVSATPRLPRPGYPLAGLAATVVLLHAMAFPSNVSNMGTARLYFRLGTASLQFLDVLPPQPAMMEYSFSDYAKFKKNADALNKLNVRNDDFLKTTRLADFKLNPQPDCGGIESAEKVGNKIYLLGWALSPDHKTPADCVLFTCEGPGIEPTILGLMDHRFDRTDLVEAFHSRKYFGAGWNKTIDEQDLPRGKLELKAFVYDVQTRQVTPLGKAITVSNP